MSGCVGASCNLAFGPPSAGWPASAGRAPRPTGLIGTGGRWCEPAGARLPTVVTGLFGRRAEADVARPRPTSLGRYRPVALPSEARILIARRQTTVMLSPRPSQATV